MFLLHLCRDIPLVIFSRATKREESSHGLLELESISCLTDPAGSLKTAMLHQGAKWNWHNVSTVPRFSPSCFANKNDGALSQSWDLQMQHAADGNY